MRDHQTCAYEREVEDWQAELDYQIDDEVVWLENEITRISRGLRQAVGNRLTTLLGNECRSSQSLGKRTLAKYTLRIFG